ncbi:AraC family transcriptional regulator [Ruminococcaceae bacterium OttesenSCG-928-L11]|nr:AraC family transcriptional regulator [Ruminococcaceae bacterium OttesenSCG-928-L11]
MTAAQPWNNQLSPMGKASFDEYSYLFDTLRRLSDKATEYESIRKDNLQIMRYGFLQSLLYNKQMDRGSIRQNADFLDLELEGPYFRVLHLQVVQPEAQSPQEQELVVYQLISNIETLSGLDGVWFYGVRNNDNTITVLCSCRTRERDALLRTLEAFNLYCGSHFRTRHAMCISEAYTDLTDIHFGCEDVTRLRPYLFYMPGREYLEMQAVPALTHPIEDMGFSVEDAAQQALEQRDPQGFRRCIREFVERCGSGTYTWESCNSHLIGVLMIVARHIRGGGDSVGYSIPRDITEQFAMCSNIDEFEVWILQMVHRCLTPSHVPDGLSPLIEKAVSYIGEHLREPISLESLAFSLGLTPNYLGRLFREETGISFVEYVNGARLEQATDILRTTEKTVEEIAAESGFNSSTYFIKKFKQKYRMTPKAFRLHCKIEERETGGL